MATKRIAEVPCWERRWVDKFEAVGLLNITMNEFNEKIEPNVHIYIGGNFDMEEVTKMMESQKIVERKYTGAKAC